MGFEFKKVICTEKLWGGGDKSHKMNISTYCGFKIKMSLKYLVLVHFADITCVLLNVLLNYYMLWI